MKITTNNTLLLSRVQFVIMRPGFAYCSFLVLLYLFRHVIRIVFRQVINPELSKVAISGTKVEITLRKARGETWKNLGELEDLKNENEKLKEEVEEIKKEIEQESDGSELDGIDDVIFD